MTTLSFTVTEQFFDRPAVERAVSRAKRKQLSKAGAFVRRGARSSIKPASRRAKKARRYKTLRDPTVSRPGKPPKLHTRSKRNLKLILFAWDSATESVVVGPVRFANKSGANVPEVLEHGGRTRIVSSRRGTLGRRKVNRATVRPRPFMAPALDREAPKFPDLFKNSVK